MFTEITMEAFYAILPSHDFEASRTKMVNLEHATKSHFHSKGVNLMTVYNHLSNVTQFYVADINS